MANKKRKVLLVGWDAADWKVIDKLMDAGLMPAFKSVVDSGVRGRLATLDPPLSPMLWTSMATGVRPYKHGILGFVEGDNNGAIRPISSHGRKVKAFWNMFTMEGLKSNVVGWWPSNPVESINGVMVSNRFQQEKKGKETIDLEDWDLEPGNIYPESMTERLSELRVHPSEITGNLVMPFVPRAIELDKKEDKRLTVIAKFLAHSASLHAACTELIDTTEWDITAVYHDAIDHFSHAFMKFNPPRMEGMDEEAYSLFKDVVKGAYVYHDMMLERLLSQIDDDTTIMIVSDHGFHSDHLRPTHVPQVPSGPAIEHAPYGIFVAAGPGIKKGEEIYGASILDVTPTLLTMYDLPIGRDMDGKPLLDIYEEKKEVKYIDSWEDNERFGGEIVVAEQVDERTNEAALQQLIDLGYIDDLAIKDGQDGDKMREAQLKATVKENNFYLAKSYASGGKFDDALELLLELEDRAKPDFRYLIEIVNASVKTKRFALAEEYINYIRKDKLMAENFLDILEAKVQIGLNKPGEALKLLESATKNYPESPNVLIDLGKILNTLRESEKAKGVFLEAIRIDPDNPYAHHGVGVAAMAEEDYETALEYFLNAVDRFYQYPLAHLHLGETLAFMKEYELAKSSFEVVATIAPSLPKTYRWLYDLNEITGDTEKAAHYKSIIAEFDLGERMVITGLPGKELNDVLQQLKESDRSIFGADDLLGNDLDVTDQEWLKKIKEDLIYVPLSFIGSLPSFYSYRILFVEESIEGVTDFFNKRMKLRVGTFNKEMIQAVERQERVGRTWLNQQPNLDIIYIHQSEELNSELVQKFISN